MNQLRVIGMRVIICSVVFSIFTSVLSAQSLPMRRNYINQYAGLAVSEMKRSGVPASISLAQGILESNCGQSALATKARNHFGIKCHDWTGAGYYMDDDAKDECFRKYAHVEQSWRDHSDFLMSKPRYERLFALNLTDYKGWAKGLKAAGYATAPDYADRLIKIIEDEQLYLYDSGKGVKTEPVVLDPNAYPNRVEVVNGVECFEAKSGDSFAKIAQFYGIKLKRILRYNDRVKDNLQPGDVVYLGKKRNRASSGYPYCRVKEGNTIYGISQQYCIKMKSLIRFNNYNQNTRLVPGEKVYLRSKPRVR